MKNILNLTNAEAKCFFLKQESYCTIDVPVYFNFQELLKEVNKRLTGKTISEFYGSIFKKDKNMSAKPFNYEHVNYPLINNKDGKYAWRHLQLIHPVIYVDLVNKITEKETWETIVQRFSEFNCHKNISCLSLPVKSNTNQSDKASAVQQWCQEIEQKSIEIGLEYSFLLHTDISDCYGSFYTHSIPWALHGKDKAKKNRTDKALIGNIIDERIRDMTYGQTNGIPQGSVLMDFIAEMILGFIDQELGKKINIKGYRILRYRDDYRIFTQNAIDAEKIVKYLTDILIGLGLRINPHKTIASSNIIRDSLKGDKRYWIGHEKPSKTLQNDLLNIHSLSEIYPNSGSLEKALSKFFNRIRRHTEIKENIIVMISIVTDIMLKSPRTYPIVSAILSKFLSFYKEKEKLEIIDKIIKRFKLIPNTSYLELWLQRITLKIDRQFHYSEKLCNKVIDPDIVIWNSEWLIQDLKNLIDSKNIVDGNKIKTLDIVIQKSEVELFRASYYES